MFSLNNQSQIFLFPKPVNLHKGIDALAHIVQAELGLKLVDNLFVLFCNRKKNRIKILHHNGEHLLVLVTRFHKTLNFKYQEGVVFDQISFYKFLNTTISRNRSNKFRIS